MPEAVTFKITTYYKLGRDETGLTQFSSRRLTAAQAIQWIMGEFPDETWEVVHDDPPEGEDWHKLALTIDWTKVPDEVRDPKLPRGHWR